MSIEKLDFTRNILLALCIVTIFRLNGDSVVNQIGAQKLVPYGYCEPKNQCKCATS
jgi:hypothetical protein